MTDASVNGIVLCGIKHSGKSTIGAALSRRLNLPLVDLDREIEFAYQRETGQALTVREIYRLLGNEEFRRREALAVQALAASGQASIVALGGGAPMNPAVRPEWLHSLGRIVLLDIAPITAFRRILTRGLPPFLTTAEDPEKEFLRMCDERLAVYRRLADVVYCIQEDSTPEQEADRIIAALDSH
ncbi:MAG TPA: shikimate kinase, partial [Lentisphaeria bacterium]|nr:shikimate kinase [Lentisphaeria bacterium]